MSDPAKGLNTVDNVARIVCKSAWGRLSCTKVDNVKQYLWELAHDTLTFCKPDNANLLANLPQLETEDWSIANYMDYIDAAFPCLTGSESEEEKAERDAQREYDRLIKKTSGGTRTTRRPERTPLEQILGSKTTQSIIGSVIRGVFGNGRR